jgi:hypothetical protein
MLVFLEPLLSILKQLR